MYFELFFRLTLINAESIFYDNCRKKYGRCGVKRSTTESKIKEKPTEKNIEGKISCMQ